MKKPNAFLLNYKTKNPAPRTADHPFTLTAEKSSSADPLASTRDCQICNDSHTEGQHMVMTKCCHQLVAIQCQAKKAREVLGCYLCGKMAKNGGPLMKEEPKVLYRFSKTISNCTRPPKKVKGRAFTVERTPGGSTPIFTPSTSPAKASALTEGNDNSSKTGQTPDTNDRLPGRAEHQNISRKDAYPFFQRSVQRFLDDLTIVKPLLSLEEKTAILRLMSIELECK